MVDYSESIEVYDIKVGKLNGYKRMYMYQRSRAFFNLWPTVTQISLISNSFCAEASGQTEVNLQVEPSWERGTQMYRNRWGHTTKMATISIYGKFFKNLLLWNRTSHDLKTWYAALGTRVLPNSFNTANDDPMLTFGLFQFCFFMHLYEKMLKWWSTTKLLKSMI